MNARFSKSIVSVLVIVLFTLALVPFAGAQEGPKPEAVGLRPDAPPYALHGPYWVGTRQMIMGQDTDRPLKVSEADLRRVVLDDRGPGSEVHPGIVDVVPAPEGAFYVECAGCAVHP